MISEFKNDYSDLLDVYNPPSFIECYKANFAPQTLQFIQNNKLDIRPFEQNKNNTKQPILIFGCSFAHGTKLLKNNQTISYKLSKLTNRNVYNFGMCGCGIQHMYFIIKNRLKIYMPIKEKPEYAIYFYIPNHLRRLNINIFPALYTNGTVLQYKIKNSKLVLEQKKYPLLYKSFILKNYYYLQDKKYEKNKLQTVYDNFGLSYELLKNSKKNLERLYPNIKFIIVRYQIENDDSGREAPFMWDTLEKEGFIIIKSEDLIGRKFKYDSEDTLIDKHHPSEQAWDLLLPKLIEKLNL